MKAPAQLAAISLTFTAVTNPAAYYNAKRASECPVETTRSPSAGGATTVGMPGGVAPTQLTFSTAASAAGTPGVARGLAAPSPPEQPRRFRTELADPRCADITSPSLARRLRAAHPPQRHSP